MGLICASIAYSALSLYLYYPYLRLFSVSDLLLIIGPVAGATGVFLLSRRWVNTNIAAIIAGAFYGFAPLTLSFSAFHPLMQMLIGALPWLFMPAVFFDSMVDRHRKFAMPAILLSALPIITVILFFWLIAKPFFGPFFPMPITIKLSLANLSSFIMPSKAAGSYFPMGFYHVGMILLLIGVGSSLMTHRVLTIAIALACMILAASGSFLEVPPMIWTLIPLLLCSVLIGQAVEFICELLNKYRLAKPGILLCVIAGVDIVVCASAIVDAIL